MKQNPFAGTAALKKWTQGVSPTDAILVAGGAAGATYLSGMLVRGDNKLMKLATSFGAAVIIGYGANAMLGSAAGKAAAMGGFAGVATQAIAMFTGISLGGPRAVSGPRRIGSASAVSPSMSREGETVSVIQP